LNAIVSIFHLFFLFILLPL